MNEVVKLSKTQKKHEKATIEKGMVESEARGAQLRKEMERIWEEKSKGVKHKQPLQVNTFLYFFCVLFLFLIKNNT